MEKFDFVKYKYLIATLVIIALFVILVANAFKYLPPTNNTQRNIIENSYDSTYEEDTVDKTLEENDETYVEENLEEEFTEEEAETLEEFDSDEPFKELNDYELEP